MRVENAEIRQRLLDGELQPGVAAVAVQSINTDIRAVSATLKAREQEELEQRLEELEQALGQRRQGGGYGVGFRDKMRRLENAARDNLASFELVDGSRFYYDPASPGLFLHICDCLTNHDKPKRPEPPELVKALARAKDRRAAFSQIVEGGDMGLFPYEVEALVERGEIVPRSLVVGYELGEPLPDLSE